jgi:hypothetical protein
MTDAYITYRAGAAIFLKASIEPSIAALIP